MPSNAKPLVSILIPAYNVEDTIGEALRCAQAQTWPAKEIIVIDDGSKDQTLAHAKQFESKNTLIVSQPNAGAQSARNKAFSLCQGEYLQWLDADDLMAPDKISLQMALVEQGAGPRTLLSGPWGRFICRPRLARFEPSPLWCDLSPVEWLLRKWENNAHMQTATWLVSRELTTAAGPWDPRLLVDQDGEYFCRVILQSDGIRFVPDAKVFYRQSPSGRVSNIGLSDRKRDSKFLATQLQINFLRARIDDARARAACVTFLQEWLIYFYPERPDLVRQIQELAASLGGKLETPRLRPKYRWLEGLFGYATAKRAQFVLPEIRASLERRWDKLRFDAESRKRQQAGISE